jgi:hypothetical protein
MARVASTDPTNVDPPPLPPAEADYQVCVYDSSGAGATSVVRMGPAVLTVNNSCQAGPCWVSSLNGFTYRDPKGLLDGMTLVSLKGGSGPALAVNGQGPAIGVPQLPVQAPVTVQLTGTLENCWSSTFSVPKTNTSTEFSGSSD